MFGESNRALWRNTVIGVVAGMGIGVIGIATASGVMDDPRESSNKELVQDDGAPTQYADRVSPVGDAVELQAAVDHVARAMGSTSVSSIRMVQAPNGALESSVPWLEVETVGDLSDPGDDVWLTWQAALAQGAIADLARQDETATNEVVGGMTLLVHTPSGRTEPLDGGSGYVAAGQVFDAQSRDLSDEAIRARTLQATREFGLKEVAIEVIRPLGPAVAISATLPEGQDVDWTIDDLRRAVLGDPLAYEGIYIEIRSARDGPLLRSGVAYRTGLGGLWFAEGQDEVFGAMHGAAPSLQGVSE